MAEKSLNGKIAVVTGASSGIGWAVTRYLLAEGVTVVGLSRRLDLMEKLRAELPVVQGKIFQPLVCDISNLSAIKSAFEQVEQKYQALHILVCCAGVIMASKLLDANKEPDLQRTMDVNVMGTLHCIKQAYPLMKISMTREEACHVLIVNSLLGHRVPEHIPDCAFNLYPVAKHALIAANEILRREFQPHKLLRLSNISPGLTKTNFGDNFADLKLPLPAEILLPEDVARGVLFILKSPAYVNVAELIMVPTTEHY